VCLPLPLHIMLCPIPLAGHVPEYRTTLPHHPLTNSSAAPHLSNLTSLTSLQQSLLYEDSPTGNITAQNLSAILCAVCRYFQSAAGCISPASCFSPSRHVIWKSGAGSCVKRLLERALCCFTFHPAGSTSHELSYTTSVCVLISKCGLTGTWNCWNPVE
jgi:hypothetical protein